MKRVIDRLIYDTQTATEVADWSNGYYPNDFNYATETLYRTRNGRWFLLGEGGAMSAYSRQCGNGWSGGSALIPLSADAALAWCQDRHVATDVIAQYWGDALADA